MSKFSNLKVDRGTLQVDEKARAYLGTTQVDLVSGVYTKVNLDTETYDPNSRFASYKFTVVVAGYYIMNGNCQFKNIVADKSYATAIYKNNAIIAQGVSHSTSTLDIITSVFTIQYLAVDDYVELFAWQNSGVDTVDITSGTFSTFLELHLLNI